MVSNEFVELIKRCQQNDQVALEQCFQQNSGLVWSLVHRFRYTKQDPQDLFQIGCIGLMKAIMNFNTTYEVMFSTYAVPMILGELKKFFREDGNLRISRSIKERYLMILKYKDKYLQEYEKEATIEQIALGLQMEQTDVILALEANQYLVSLDEPYALKDGSTIRLEDKIESSDIDLLKYITLHKEISKLSNLEKRLLYYRYELALNQTIVAEKLEMSQVQVSRLEKKILMKLKELMS